MRDELHREGPTFHTVPPPAQAQGGGAPEHAMPETDLTSLHSQLDELWKRRDVRADHQRAESLALEGLKAHPRDVGLLWRAARVHFWTAETSSDPKVRQELSRRGWDEAERAVSVDPECPEARYWSASACGTYAEAVGVLAALAQGIEGKFRKNLDWTVERAPELEWGSPKAILGRYWAQLPWPKRDRKKALSLLREAASAHPENLRTRFYLAETLLAEGGGHRREALDQLDRILAAPSDYDEPEARLIQQWAKALKPRIEKELP